MSQLINTKVFRYIRIEGQIELKDENGFYTGEIVDNYSKNKNLRAVIKRESGQIHSEQFGTLYQYEASLQHKGKPILEVGDLVFVDSTTSVPDMIVREIVPSLNYTRYYLEKKEASPNV